MSLQTQSHERTNLLTGERVLVSPQRDQRPWQGQVEAAETSNVDDYDPDCYLCPGNARAHGHVNPAYTGPYAFDNDFPALSGPGPAVATNHAFFQASAIGGCCRVVCFSESHQRRLAGMDADEAARVLRFLFEQFAGLDRQPDIAYVQIFENRGAMMGCSNPHPHAQIWATSTVPAEPEKELHTQTQHLEQHGSVLLLDYLAAELKAGERIVHQNRHAVSLVPWWAVWPYETLLIPVENAAGPDELDDGQLSGFCDALLSTLHAYERLFQTAVPYSMGCHPRPSDGKPHPEWQFHAHIYPPLLRSATVRKHLVGFEMLGMPQRDLTPEAATRHLLAALAHELPR